MDTFFWIASKVLWQVSAPNHSLVIILVAGTFLLWTRKQRLGRLLVSISVAVILTICIFPIDKWLLWPLEERFPVIDKPPQRVDGIIVLGGGEDPRISAMRGQPALTAAAERLTTFVELARRYPEAKLVYAGGSGALDEQDFKGADAARQLFERLGLDTRRVLFDSQSRNTLENAANGYRLAKPQKDETWLLITSAWHVPRAVGIFRNLGWPVIPYPVDYLTTGHWKMDWGFGGLSAVKEVSWVLREWTGNIVYGFLGKSSGYLPGP